MKNCKYFCLEIDDTVFLYYPCSKWEVSCILVPASTTKMFVEFKTYTNEGKQILESHYVTTFKIIEK